MHTFSLKNYFIYTENNHLPSAFAQIQGYVPGRGTKFCDEYVSFSVNRPHNSNTARPNFTKLFVHVACGRGSVFL